LLRETRDRSTSAPKSAWPADSKSAVKKAAENTVTLADEPVMRIALSTGTSAATISTTARLLAASDLPDASQPLDTARVRVESRMLSIARPAIDHLYEVMLATSLPREEADRLSESVKQSVDEQPQVVAESADKWRVVIQKETTAQVEEARAKLDDAGFEVISVRDIQKQTANNAGYQKPAAGFSILCG
jgi:hypothetical protein